AIEYYRRVVEKFDLYIKLFERVNDVAKQSDGTFQVSTSKNKYKVKNVIISTGFYDVPVPMRIPGEELSKVTHYYKDPHLYAFQNVVVVGANNSAIDAALETYRKGANVTLVIRNSEIGSYVKYWVRPDIENRIKEGEIKAYYNTELSKITPDHVFLNTPEGEVVLDNDFVIAMTGYTPDFEMLKRLGVDLSGAGLNCPVYNPETMESNLEGLYLAGVVCGGMDTHKWFIENSRIHATQIFEHLRTKASL
ncbi:MAG: YpdA family putative bacillithiol disulfide reductase, partial [Pedobacter sp.]